MKKQKEDPEQGFVGGEQDGAREARRGNRHTRPAEDGGKLPGEEEGVDEGWTDGEGDTDEQKFVALREVGETFTGVFLRHIPKGHEGLKHEGLLFAEFPSGNLKVVRADWSLQEKIAEKEREEADYFERFVMRATLVNIVPKGDDNKVKLYRYQWKAIPASFRVNWTEEHPAK